MSAKPQAAHLHNQPIHTVCAFYVLEVYTARLCEVHSGPGTLPLGAEVGHHRDAPGGAASAGGDARGGAARGAGDGPRWSGRFCNKLQQVTTSYNKLQLIVSTRRYVHARCMVYNVNPATTQVILTHTRHVARVGRGRSQAIPFVL